MVPEYSTLKLCHDVNTDGGRCVSCDTLYSIVGLLWNKDIDSVRLGMLRFIITLHILMYKYSIHPFNRQLYQQNSLRSPGGQKFSFSTITADFCTAVLLLTRNLEIWMGENLLTPFTEGTNLLYKAWESTDTMVIFDTRTCTEGFHKGLNL